MGGELETTQCEGDSVGVTQCRVAVVRWREREREKESGVAQWVRHDLGLALTHFWHICWVGSLLGWVETQTNRLSSIFWLKLGEK
jgi:hypothetical protein